MQAHAKSVGQRLRELILKIRDSPAGHMIGDVRGSGLFIGIDLVLDSESREPATRHASILCSRLKDRHNILTSLDGAFDNVIVVKPPLCFNHENAEHFAAAIEQELQLITDADLADFRHTPT